MLSYDKGSSRVQAALGLNHSQDLSHAGFRGDLLLFAGQDRPQAPGHRKRISVGPVCESLPKFVSDLFFRWQNTAPRR